MKKNFKTICIWQQKCLQDWSRNDLCTFFFKNVVLQKIYSEKWEVPNNYVY